LGETDEATYWIYPILKVNSMSDEEIINKLEGSGDYRVLRRLKTPTQYNQPDGTGTKIAILLDLETTGLNADKDEIIEIALVPFTYSNNGRIFEVHEGYNELQEPKEEIPQIITQITGITDELVRGHMINFEKVQKIVEPAALIIAHNADFDRKFAEKMFAFFKNKAWACSMTNVSWQEEQFESQKLEYLAMRNGFFYDGHRATADCYATIELLARTLPQSGALALSALLDSARLMTYRVWAEGSPFDFKDILKARGYRWNDGNNGQPRSWYRDVNKDELEEELLYLHKEIYQREVEVQVVKITAFDRFSERI
jgi:DNA polymerase-3 subunit epsilon